MTPENNFQYPAYEIKKDLELDVLLVLPPLYQTGRESDYNPKEPAGLMSLASNLRRFNKKVEIFDADIESKTINQTVNKILEKNTPLVGFSVFQRALPSFELIVNELRKRGYMGRITCGGITPTLSSNYILEKMGDKIDSVVLGEGENIIRNLVNRILKGEDWKSLPGLAYCYKSMQIINKNIESVDLDSLPFTARDYLSFCLDKTNYATIMGSRGCYGICSFCSNYSFERLHSGPNWRPRNPARVVDEMEELFEQYNVDVFKFNDPNIFGPGENGKQHVLELCHELRRRDLSFHLMGFCRANDIGEDLNLIKELKFAGFERLLIGIESSDDSIIQKFRKGEKIAGIEKTIDLLQSFGISTVAGFMIFNPYTTLDSLKKDLFFLKRKGLMPTLTKSLRVFDGTSIQSLLESEGRLIKNNPFDGYHDYLMSPEIASIYASMKVLFVNCIDRIRSIGQSKIWDIKKTTSFQNRHNFNNLSEIFFNSESLLLENLINWTEKKQFKQEEIKEVIDKVYLQLEEIGKVVSIDIKSVVPSPNIISKEIFNLIREKSYNTFKEEYRWNMD